MYIVRICRQPFITGIKIINGTRKFKLKNHEKGIISDGCGVFSSHEQYQQDQQDHDDDGQENKRVIVFFLCMPSFHLFIHIR